jgi:hypothetical protein
VAIYKTGTDQTRKTFFLAPAVILSTKRLLTTNIPNIGYDIKRETRMVKRNICRGDKLIVRAVGPDVITSDRILFESLVVKRHRIHLTVRIIKVDTNTTAARVLTPILEVKLPKLKDGTYNVRIDWKTVKDEGAKETSKCLRVQNYFVISAMRR